MKKFKSSVDIDGALTVGGLPVVGGGGAGAIATTIIDAKGDLIVGSAVDTAARLAAGTNGQVLSADSAETTGLKWVDANFSGGGGSSFAGWQDYTPTLAQGISTDIAKTVVYAKWAQIGRLVFVQGRLNITGTGTANDHITVTLPAPMANDLVFPGSGTYIDVSAAQWIKGVAVPDSSPTVISFARTDTTSTTRIGKDPNIAVDSGDYIFFDVFYETTTDAGSGASSSATNLLHNPAFEIWQRGTGSTSCPAGARTFLADRWFVRPAGAAVTQQQSTSVPVGSYARYALQIDGAASVTTVDIAQRVEAANVPALARTVTFSWRVYNGTGASVTPSLLIGTPAASDDFTTVTNRLTQTLQACADAAWTTVSHTVDISGYTNLAYGMEIALQFPSGSVIAGDVVRITEAQVTATNGVVGFNRPGVKSELEECHRYYWRWQSNDGTEVIGLPGVSTSTAHTYFFGIQLPTAMRSVPVVSSNGLDAFRTGWGYYPLNNGVALADWNSTTTLAPTLARTSGTWGSEYPVFLAIQAPVAGKYLDANAEL